eukprot:4632906-Prymnesium_polylepis.1
MSNRGRVFPKAFFGDLISTCEEMLQSEQSIREHISDVAAQSRRSDPPESSRPSPAPRAPPNLGAIDSHRTIRDLLATRRESLTGSRSRLKQDLRRWSSTNSVGPRSTNKLSSLGEDLVQAIGEELSQVADVVRKAVGGRGSSMCPPPTMFRVELPSTAVDTSSGGRE